MAGEGSAAQQRRRTKDTVFEGWSRTRLGIPAPEPPTPAGAQSTETRDPRRVTAMSGRRPARPGTAVLFEPGRQVPGTPYRIVRWLGDGGMGIVYEAEHVALERRVALKVLRPEASGSATETRMFRQEARTVSKIGSDYIVEVFDLDELPDGRVWFAMQLLDGSSLEQVIAEGPIDPARGIGILRQICKGLAAAHAAGVVHRDVKPDNIALLRRRGRDDAVKILDFGVSALLSDVEQGSVVAAGTPYYLAPELAAGLPYDARVDLYSLGCTAYEMFAGRPPFDAEEVDELVLAHVEREPPPLIDAARVELPPALAAVVMRCLAKRPDDRHASAAELEAALCDAQIRSGLRTTWDDLELPDIEPERREQLMRRMPHPVRRRRSKRGLSLVVASAVMASVAAGLGTWQWLDRSAHFEDLDLIERLAIDARAAAAKSYFVYPPANDPEHPTAYRKVLALESLDDTDDSDAKSRATQLRSEFAETLMRLGDRYWEQDGGRPFAVDYYAAALIFDGALDRARERVSMTPGELAQLRQKAETQAFSDAELEASEALVALAEEDPDKRLEKLEQLQQDDGRAAVAGAGIDKIIENETARRGRPRRHKRATEDAAANEPAAAPAPEPPPTDEPASDQPAEPEPPTPKRDPVAARGLVDEGDAALRQGELTKARRAFERAVAADGSYAAAYDGLGRVSFHRADYAAAARLTGRAVRLAPRNAEYRIHLGDAHYKAFRYREARREYARARDLGHAAADARLKKVDVKLGS